MNELIKTITRDDGTIAVSGRELHDFLEVDTPYTQWFDRMIDYGFTENTDFKGLSQKSEKPIGGRPRIDHVMTLDMAKEVAMIQRTDRGKQARQYFIEIDKQAHHDMTGLSPATRAAVAATQALAAQERRLNRVDAKVNAISDIVSISTMDWRRATRDIITKIAHMRGDDYQATRKDIYKDVEQRGGYSLSTRLTNLRNRMAGEGQSLSKRNKTNKVDVIGNDKRLIEIYMAVVKDHAIKYRVWDNEY
ncbi:MULTISPECIES: antA/AntB antirepressor family protein [Lacticaseibacillus]|uniref:Phage antirepressor protein n=1 Tax=Lacticaseibacillus casei DSM 20011 = JCM 1134 = ATCC 393 TaxID=1423732 RepID=A0AAD1AM57_LACCA|nr:antA/AntB antirepressor family protein [Lacticaseibacillus casei]MBI6598247.1 antA/AntB antirepressor family protein [Lacticaseibacillus casei]MBO1482013.1 antA/AntB antirepressor family protein [Lacticaseibacillus casei]MBO2417488.1 antA/AntB antirepressor family protein [Lacticaseibacillus casei]MCK2081701.1 antA/AntB antirepressor family protein [Lacticaseibacillus casei]MED7631543.1 phage antirepressor Ant [Lacticaseibacillus casei]